MHSKLIGANENAKGLPVPKNLARFEIVDSCGVCQGNGTRHQTTQLCQLLVSVPRSLPHKVSCGESSSGIALKVFWSCAAKNKGKYRGQWRTHLLFDSALKKEATTILSSFGTLGVPDGVGPRCETRLLSHECPWYCGAMRIYLKLHVPQAGWPVIMRPEPSISIKHHTSGSRIRLFCPLLFTHSKACSEAKKKQLMPTKYPGRILDSRGRRFLSPPSTLEFVLWDSRIERAVTRLSTRL